MASGFAIRASISAANDDGRTIDRPVIGFASRTARSITSRAIPRSTHSPMSLCGRTTFAHFSRPSFPASASAPFSPAVSGSYIRTACS